MPTAQPGDAGFLQLYSADNTAVIRLRDVTMKARVKWNEMMMNDYVHYLLMLIKLQELKPHTTQYIISFPHYTHPHILHVIIIIKNHVHN